LREGQNALLKIDQYERRCARIEVLHEDGPLPRQGAARVKWASKLGSCNLGQLELARDENGRMTQAVSTRYDKG
jgi:hypothetical protein